MPKRVLIFAVAYLPYVGGAELAIKEITDRIGDIQFDLITLRFDSSHPKFERLGNVNVYRVGFSRSKPAMADLIKFPLKLNKYFFPFTAYFRARQLHKRNLYDAIWAVMAAYAGFAALFFKLRNRRVPYLLTLQEGDPIESILKRVRFISFLFKKIFTEANFVQAISHYLANWARQMNFKGELAVVPNAVDIKHFSQPYTESELAELKSRFGKKQDEKYLITTSRLVSKNAVDDVIKSLQFLPENIKFLVLGTGPGEEKLKRLAAELKFEKRVMFLGQVGHKEMPKYLGMSDIFIRPSLSEGLGNSFLEAMAAGIPVIGTSVGGIPDFLFDPETDHGKLPTGLFCEVRNPQSIAKKVKTLLENNELRQKIVANAKNLVNENYDWSLIASKMQTIFDKLIIIN